MSIHLISSVWQRVDLPTNQKIVLLKLADFADNDGAVAWPSVGRVAHECALGVRTVRRALRALEADLIIVCVGNEAGGAGLTRGYRIDLERALAMRPLPAWPGANLARKAANLAAFSARKKAATVTERRPL